MVIITGTIIFGLITDTDKLHGEIILFISFFFIVGIFVFNIFLWHLKGKEKVSLSDKELIVEKLGTIFTSKRKYDIQDIDVFSLTEKPTTPFFIRFWGLGGGQIQFNYFGQFKYFGQTLTGNDAKTIINKLNNKLKTTTR